MRAVEGVAEIEDVGSFVAALGAVGERHGVTVQAFDARYVVDRAHLELAAELAARAYAREDAIAEDFGVEILLYAAGRRQINRALEMGVSEGECPVVVAVVPGIDEGLHVGNYGEEAEDGATGAAAAAVRDRLEPGSTLGEYDTALVREFFDVTDSELDATAGDLADAVRERVALLPVEK
ncbi:KEOPS complex subunit Cgi121 [Haloarcula salina]|uniref:KEOPS complex subunit Cgi121 n=1 Tax=Haloarcula salina TaxID=1429914 RepID=UPI003C7045A8